jgi:hypothetical protein
MEIDKHTGHSLGFIAWLVLCCKHMLCTGQALWVGAAPLHHALLQPWSDLCMGACVCMWCLLCKLLVGYAMLLGKHMLAAVVVGHEEVN